MRPLRVAHVINSLGLGGVPKSVYHLLRFLPKDRYVSYVYLLRNCSDQVQARSSVSQSFTELGVILRSPQCDAKKFNVTAELCEWILRDEIDVLHTHSYKPNIYGRLAGVMVKSQRPLHIVAHYHNFYDDKWTAEGSLIYDKLLLGYTDRLLACSPAVAKHVSGHLTVDEVDVEVVQNGVVTDCFQPHTDRKMLRRKLDLPADATVVATVGRLSTQKAQDVFIAAAAEIVVHFPSTLFLVVGGEDNAGDLERLQALAAKLGISDRVRFAGYIADMPSVYGAIDILVTPSRWEGFGLVLVEAMACGIPIVATRVGAIPDVVAEGETALLVPSDAPAKLADAVITLLEAPERARAMGERGIERAKLFSWEQASAKLDAVYTAAIAKGGLHAE